MHNKSKLIKKVWESSEYYNMAKEGSLNVNHPGMLILKDLSKRSKKILDLGCGEGSRLNELVNGNVKGYGVDISKTAINLAKKNYPRLNFIESDLEKIDINSEDFDLIYSAFVLEHLDNPKKVLNEAIRLLSVDGSIVLIAPNYGAPNRCSPPFVGSRLKKLIIGFLNDIFNFSDDIEKWSKVKPLINKYFTDSDVTVEPYLRSLILFFKSKGFEIKRFTSCWSEESKVSGIHQRIFRFFDELGIFPFLFWGPHLVLVVKK